MKTRQGFVSNSSTSSFICLVCGRNEAGSDNVSMEDYGFMSCVKGHEFCEEHLVTFKGARKPKDVTSIPASRCPICTMTAMDRDLEAAFLRKVLGWTPEEALAQAKEKGGGTYEGFLKFLQEEG